jgi:tetratricopeptide (TPR) repeat protein
MQASTYRLAATFVVLATLFLSLGSYADEPDASDSSAHLLQAEVAMQRQDYLEATRQYLRAAEISQSANIAQKATVTASSYGFHAEALSASKLWRKLSPDSDEALFFLARSQLRLGKTRDARRSYREFLDAADAEPDQLFLRLVSSLADEDPVVTDEIITWLAKPYKDSAYAHYAVAVTAVQVEDIERAQKRALQAIELAPDWIRPKLLYGRSLLLDGDADASIDYIARLIGDNPQPDPAARMELALVMMAAGRDDDALSQVNQIQYETGNQPDALRLMAILNFRQQNLDAAEEDFEDLLSTGQHAMDAYYYLARIADFRGETDRALRLYSRVTTGVHTVPAQRRAAIVLAIQGEAPDTALERIDEFARLEPVHAVDMMQVKAQLLALLERYDESLDLYSKLIDFRPGSEGISLGRAELLLRMGRLDDAIVQYRRAVDSWPESALSLNALGYTLADRTEQYKEAEKLIRKALNYDPESAAIIDSLGWVLHKRGKNEEALVELQRAYATLDDPEVASHIVEVLIALNRKDEALEFLAAAEEKSPENSMLQDVRKRLFAGTE